MVNIRYSMFVLCCFMFPPTCSAQIAAKQLALIKLPKASEFETQASRDDIGKVVTWMSDLEATFLVDSFDLTVTGEYGRSSAGSRGVGQTLLNSLSFRTARNAENDRWRQISSEQSLLGNPTIDSQSGFVTDRTMSFDLLSGSHDKQAYLRLGRSRDTFVDEKATILAMVPNQAVFHPFRASVTGVDQILNGHAAKISGHSLLAHTIKRVLKKDKYTFVWVEILGNNSGVNQIVTFDEGYPVQVDHWAGIDEKADSFVTYETTRTVWREHKAGKRLPHQLYGIRNSKSRPAEFYFECDWRWGKDVDEALFNPDTLGETPVISIQ